MNDTTNNTEQNNVEMTVGEILRNARTTGRRKREIQTIAKQLCISEEFLQALEDGNYAAIPEVVYILGFARNYAMELGLDPDEIVTKIKREMGLEPDCAPDNDAADASGCAVATAGASKSKDGFIISAWAFVRRNWMWFAVGLVALGVAVAAVVMFTLASAAETNATNVADVPVVEAPAITEPVYNKDVRERFGTENRNNADVILQAMQESWVKVEDGRGNTVFSRVLVPGDVYYVPAGANYKATFGNAGGIDIWVNGTLAAKAGPAHTRKAGISLNPDNLPPAPKMTE